MKVGDLVKFSKWHHSRTGYEYTDRWIGIIYRRAPGRRRAKVQWVTATGAQVFGSIDLTNTRSYKVICEGR